MFISYLSVKDKLIHKLYTADVWAVSLEHKVRLEFVFRDAKQFTGLTHCQARNKEALSFAFNASLSSVNVARAFAREQGLNLSVGSTKTLLHNAAMVDRFIAMSRTRPNLRFNRRRAECKRIYSICRSAKEEKDVTLNNTDFKELLFYVVCAVA